MAALTRQCCILHSNTSEEIECVRKQHRPLVVEADLTCVFGVVGVPVPGAFLHECRSTHELQSILLVSTKDMNPI